MKFLCVACDQPMKLESVERTGGGSLTVLYSCPGCSQRTAMLTNPLETEMVSSLGVKIGPGPAARSAAPAMPASPATAAPDSATHSAVPPVSGSADPAVSRCPFSGVVRELEDERAAAPGEPAWSAAALARLEGIPDFVRPMAKQGIEHYARSNGYAEIDEQVLDEARARFGM
ncbi:MAG TPA: PCP reductase family protein [Thermoanaerobaculia bacterium]|nr:PCP reductase family protein [Thermoanaerobaculia bacterium]